MKKLLITAATAVIAVTGLNAFATTLNGAGASFPAPVYRVWTYNYKKTTDVRVNYQSVGSGAGINQIRAKTVDFGASDKPLKKAELDKYGLVQFPMLMGGVVVVVNIPGVKTNQLKLDGSTLAAIFLGKIRKWDDPAITKLNPGIKIPAVPITVVHRSDSSGTTWIFTNYLTKVSKEWASQVGNGKAVKWPVGIGGQKNPGVCNNVFKVRGSIGYVEYTYAFESKLATVCLKNQAGNFVKPELKAFQAAGASADWKNAPGYYMVLTDQPGKNSWPITGVTYILIYKAQKELAKAQELLKYFKWCYNQGATTAVQMHYVPIPKNVVSMVTAMWNREVKCKGQLIR
ncbi:phosphate ABC transporter substrate-binding protein PstS [Lentisphaerota bacterium ZTH]|nr:phosphate ABC transporter substrate-binding protein PstS [Lentisphaerota bacterium]WET06767.1 phosphate ABC transporter substrate-binding protein PstS [Lentisphaerota bacterium ZTH]